MQSLDITLEGRDVAAMALFVASDDARGCTGGSFLSTPVSAWCDRIFTPARWPRARAGCAGAS
jgi:hypothetical protein